MNQNIQAINTKWNNYKNRKCWRKKTKICDRKTQSSFFWGLSSDSPFLPPSKYYINNCWRKIKQVKQWEGPGGNLLSLNESVHFRRRSLSPPPPNPQPTSTPPLRLLDQWHIHRGGSADLSLNLECSLIGYYAICSQHCHVIMSGTGLRICN